MQPRLEDSDLDHQTSGSQLIKYIWVTWQNFFKKQEKKKKAKQTDLLQQFENGVQEPVFQIIFAGGPQTTLKKQCTDFVRLQMSIFSSLGGVILPVLMILPPL